MSRRRSTWWRASSTSVEESLPGSARVVKNIGDGVMIVGTDPVALTDWAIGFQEGFERRSRPRIGLHYGRTVYRDGDYYGGNVNLASRVVARAHAGEVLVTDTVVAAAGERTDLEFEPIGEVQLKGFRGADVALPRAARPAQRLARAFASASAFALAFASASRAACAPYALALALRAALLDVQHAALARLRPARTRGCVRLLPA